MTSRPPPLPDSQWPGSHRHLDAGNAGLAGHDRGQAETTGPCPGHDGTNGAEAARPGQNFPTGQYPAAMNRSRTATGLSFSGRKTRTANRNRTANADADADAPASVPTPAYRDPVDPQSSRRGRLRRLSRSGEFRRLSRPGDAHPIVTRPRQSSPRRLRSTRPARISRCSSPAPPYAQCAGDRAAGHPAPRPIDPGRSRLLSRHRRRPARPRDRGGKPCSLYQRSAAHAHRPPRPRQP